MRIVQAGLGLLLGLAVFPLISACTPSATSLPGAAAATRLAATPGVGAALSPTASPSAISPAAATAAAAASPAAATAVAAASPLATQLAVLAVPVRLVDARWQRENLTVALRNAGSEAVDLSGWRLQAGAASATLPSGSRVAPGETLTVHTAEGRTTARDLYLGRAGVGLAMGLRPGARIALVSPLGFAVGEVAVLAAGS